MSVLNKKILLGITGSIAAYKAIELVRLLTAQGATVQVVMTASAQEFVTPLSLQAVSGRPVRLHTFDLAAEAAMSHIELARWADLIVIAPASANVIAELAYGFAQDLLSTLCLASTAPLYIVPAMNRVMWEHEATQANIKLLKNRGTQFLGPCTGLQACGENGWGRMMEPGEIVNALSQANTCEFSLKGHTVLITAGPTQEALDPVRYLSNHSSGKMGYALAEAALQGGAKVILISGPVALTPPTGAEFHPVKTALEMQAQVMAQVSQCSIFIGCAAVADYRPTQATPQKIKKLKEELTLTLVKNPDIIASVAAIKGKKRPFVLGFAAETENCVMHGQQKLQQKNLDMIAINDVSHTEIGFQSDDNALTVLFQNGSEHSIRKCSKKQAAKELLRLLATQL